MAVMKYLLLVASLNYQAVYPNAETCLEAEARLTEAGHVAVCINSKKLIHAYGPRKKVIVMNIKKTIDEIEKKSNLKVKFIRNESN